MFPVVSASSTSVGYEVVREESLDGVRDDLISVMNATRQKSVGATRFGWLYDGNPAGRAVIWSLRKCETGEVVGFTSCLPRRMLVNGTERLAWIGSDFSVLPKFRTLGLAAKLRRAAKEAIDNGEADFLYAHPNDRMAAVHQRVGHQRIGLMQRFARLLRTGPILQEQIGSAAVASMGGAVLDPFLRVADPEKRFRRSHVIERQVSADFDQRFDCLFEKAAPRNGVIGVRDALYLNWRYGTTNPLYQSHLVTASKKGRLVGYLVFNVEEDSLMIRDLFPATDEIIARDLLSEVTRWGRELRLRSATFTVFQSHPILPVLKRMSYRPRLEQSQMFAYAPPACGEHDLLMQADNWHIVVGDRDV